MPSFESNSDTISSWNSKEGTDNADDNLGGGCSFPVIVFTSRHLYYRNKSAEKESKEERAREEESKRASLCVDACVFFTTNMK